MERVKVRCLEPGDVLTPTEREVVWVGSTLSTPTGYRTIHLRRGERIERNMFRANTVVTIHNRTEAQTCGA